MKKLLASAVFLGGVLMAPSQVWAANLIVNGGFETGDFTGWTQSGNTGFTFVTNGPFDNFNPNTGTFFAALGPVGSDGFLSQTFNDTAGQLLQIVFYLANDGNAPNDFSASFNSTTLVSLTNDSAHGYTQYTFTAVATGHDTLTIGGFRNDPGYFALDDVSVNTLVPEPASLALLGAGLAGLGLAHRRRKTA